MNLFRHIDGQIKNHFSKYKEVLILLGSRQTGKTTLIQRIFPDALYLLLDNEPVRRALESYDINVYKSLFVNTVKTIVIDEIHLLSNPGRAAKIIYDQIPGINLIITGSSSFNIKNKTSESLAGRKIEYKLYPLTFSEYLYQKGVIPNPGFHVFNKITEGSVTPEKGSYLFDIHTLLNDVLLYGLYPGLINHPRDTRYLKNFVDSLIYKDIIELNFIENRRLAANLLKLLAHQTGNLINYSELAEKLQADQRTIKRYIEIFEESFTIFRLFPYSKFKRDEVIKSPKIYFYDTGLRNALIDDFSDLDTRPDKGALFENFIISEFLKSNQYQEAGYKLYFWRTKQKSEIDLVLEKSNSLTGIEIKYKNKHANRAFLNRYPESVFKNISSENFF
jgi:uncharacterized protein